MLATIRSKPSDEQVEAVRKKINVRFKNHPGLGTNMLRPVAHDVLNKILAGNYVDANIGLGKLGLEGEHDMRTYLETHHIDLPRQ